MKFNGITKDYLSVNMDLYRPPTPPIEFMTHASALGGERVRNTRFTGYELPVPVVIRSSKRIEELKGELAVWLLHDEAKKLEFVDMPNKYYLARYRSMELDERIHYAKGVINFYLPVAHRFGLDKSFNVGTSFANHSVTGQLKTPWTSLTVFTAAATRYIFENDQGGKITLNHAFGVGDRLEIDYEKRLIKLNGVARMALLSLDSRWFMLQAGVNRLRASHATAVSYTETYY